MDEEQRALIRRIASVVGHELRNPLAVINNSAYFVRTKLAGAPAPDPKIEKHLGIIASEIARADRIIGDMLSFSRPLELHPAAADLTAIAETALQDCAVPDGIKTTLKKPKAGIMVRADARVIGDALRRIIYNALAAMGGQGTLTVLAGAAGGSGFVEVRDSGSGLAPEALAALFQPFFTTKPRGLGLGLAIAQKAAAAHQGRLSAKNLPGGGASLTLSLPQA